MSKIRVGVLRGGPSGEYEVSLQSGQNVILSLSPSKYDITDVLITRDGAWNSNGLLSSPIRAMRKMDIFFNALHGEYGEDGKLQQMLEQHNFPFTGSRSFSSALSMNKLLAKGHFKKAGLLTPPHIFFRALPNDRPLKNAVRDSVFKVFQSFSGPYIVKPVSGGSSIGVKKASNIDDLFSVLFDAFFKKENVFIEKAIKGREVTCGVVQNFQGEDLYALPPIEIRAPKGKDFFDYESKYDGSSEEIPYGSFSQGEIDGIQDIAREVHRALGLSQYSRTDMIVSPEGKIYVLEVNTLPGLTDNSLLPKAIRAAGFTMPDFFDHLLTTALPWGKNLKREERFGL